MPASRRNPSASARGADKSRGQLPTIAWIIGSGRHARRETASAPPARFEHLAFDHFLLQPMDGPARDANTQAAVAYCMAHPQWRLCLQTHKYLGIP